MRTKIVKLVVILLAAMNLTAQDVEFKEEFRYHSGARIEYDRGRPHLQEKYEVIPGDRLVFEYITNNAGEPGNAMVAETYISFQVGDTADAFVLNADDFESSEAIYIQMCRCQDKGIQPLNRGTIKGKKDKNGIWNVEIDAYATGRRSGGTYHLEVRGAFKEKSE